MKVLAGGTSSELTGCSRCGGRRCRPVVAAPLTLTDRRTDGQVESGEVTGWSKSVEALSPRRRWKKTVRQLAAMLEVNSVTGFQPCDVSYENE